MSVHPVFECQYCVQGCLLGVLMSERTKSPECPVCLVIYEHMKAVSNNRGAGACYEERGQSVGWLQKREGLPHGPIPRS